MSKVKVGNLPSVTIDDKEILMGDETGVNPAQLRVMRNHVLIKRDLQEKVTAGGIVIASAAKEPSFTGRIVKLGEITEPGYKEEIREGDRVHFADRHGEDIVIGGANYIVLELDELIGVYDEEA